MTNCFIVGSFVIWFSLFILVTPYSYSKENHYPKYDPDELQILLSARRSRFLQSNSLLDVSNHNRTKLATTVRPRKCQGSSSYFINMVVSSLDMTPDESEVIDVKYIFYSRSGRVPTFISMSNKYIPKIVPLKFDPRKETVVIVHGFQSGGNARWVKDMTDAFLQWGDLNVIVVDWKNGGQSLKYWRAFSNVKVVGRDMNKFLKFMVYSAKLRPKKLHLIGHSLGAHICSHAAKGIKGIKRITGLDPTHVCLSIHYLGAKLGKSDADFVDVIHTNGGVQFPWHLGVREPLGHADFYPNGGSSQPSCPGATSIYDLLLGVVKKLACDHARAYLYFTETLRHPGCVFFALPWDPYDIRKKTIRCALPNSSEGPAESPPCTLMGMPADIMKANGTYYVEIKKDEPWCRFVNFKKNPKAAEVMKLFMNRFRGYPEPASPFNQTTGLAEAFNSRTHTSRDVN